MNPNTCGYSFNSPHDEIPFCEFTRDECTNCKLPFEAKLRFVGLHDTAYSIHGDRSAGIETCGIFTQRILGDVVLFTAEIRRGLVAVSRTPVCHNETYKVRIVPGYIVVLERVDEEPEWVVLVDDETGSILPVGYRSAGKDRFVEITKAGRVIVCCTAEDVNALEVYRVQGRQ